MTATAQNIKRMVKVLSRRGPLKEAMAGINTVYLLFIAVLQITIRLSRNIKKIRFGDQNLLIET